MIESVILQPLAIDLNFGIQAYYELMGFRGMQTKVDNNYFDAMKQAQNTSLVSTSFNLQKKIAVVELQGTMMVNDTLCRRGIGFTVAELQKANQDQNVIGAVLKTNSGGGAVVAAQQLANAIQDFEKPIVQYIDGISASGAVFAGVNTDKIISGGATTETGSIGVMITLDKNLLSYFKDNYIEIYSDLSGNKNQEFRELIEKGTNEKIKENLNQIAKEFQNIVKKNRANIDTSALTGAMYQAKDAKKMGLIDEIGTMKTAFAAVEKLAKQQQRTQGKKILLENLNIN